MAGATRRPAPRMVHGPPMRWAGRLAIQLASTTIIRILAISENWNWSPKTVTQRATPPTPSPMTRELTSSAMLAK